MTGTKGSTWSKHREERSTVTTRLPKEMLHAMEAIAEKERRSISQLILFFCEYGLDAYKKDLFTFSKEKRQ